MDAKVLSREVVRELRGIPNCQTKAKDVEDRIDTIMSAIRGHLREAFDNDAIKAMNFTYEFSNGGVRRSDVEVTVKYKYIKTAL